jgi:hypothetical protein
MKKIYDIPAMQYMRAHGNSPGPTHRPSMTGAIAGLLAAVPCLVVGYLTGALTGESERLGVGTWTATILDALILVIAGVIYAEIFKRAANDTFGGWLFGACFGFLIWMDGPVTLWRWVAGEPMARGMSAMGLFAAQIVYGLVLGGVFPYINRLLQTRMK